MVGGRKKNKNFVFSRKPVEEKKTILIENVNSKTAGYTKSGIRYFK